MYVTVYVIVDRKKRFFRFFNQIMLDGNVRMETFVDHMNLSQKQSSITAEILVQLGLSRM